MAKFDIQSILSELTNISLVLLGLSISIFTVVYAFLASKKSDLDQILSKENLNKANPYDIQKKHFAIKYIHRFTAINKKLLRVIFVSLVLFLTTFLYNRFFFTQWPSAKEFLLYFFSILTISLLFYFVYIFIDIIKKYKRETAI